MFLNELICNKSTTIFLVKTALPAPIIVNLIKIFPVNKFHITIIPYLYLFYNRINKYKQNCGTTQKNISFFHIIIIHYNSPC